MWLTKHGLAEETKYSPKGQKQKNYSRQQFLF